MAGLKDLHSAPDLLKVLKESAQSKLSAKEVFEQRVSFIYGSVKLDSNVTKEQIRKVIREGAGDTNDSVRANGD